MLCNSKLSVLFFTLSNICIKIAFTVFSRKEIVYFQKNTVKQTKPIFKSQKFETELSIFKINKPPNYFLKNNIKPLIPFNI